MKNQPIQQLPNGFGEIPMQHAPLATLQNGVQAIPQQFLTYHRTKRNVEHIISRITFSEHYPLFVIEENHHLFLQVGIIGQENYPPNQKRRDDKIVYGRLWKIETHQPTSEIIQTAFLAIIKAREHELREFLALSYQTMNTASQTSADNKTHKATLFNSHLDLPLMAKNEALFALPDEKTLQPSMKEIKSRLNAVLKRLYLGDNRFQLCQCQWLNQEIYLLLNIVTHNEHTQTQSQSRKYMQASPFPELSNTQISMLLSIENNDLALIENRFLFCLMDKLLLKNQQFVEESFYFDGFARFSRQQNVQAIGQFSLDTRLFDKQTLSATFENDFKYNSHMVDGARAPNMASTQALATQQQKALDSTTNLQGYLPKNYQFI